MSWAPVIPLESVRPLPALPDSTLVERARGGDRVAQGELYDRYAPLVLGRVTRLLRCSAEAEDVTQEAFLTAFRDLTQLRDSVRFGPWVLAIAVHRVHRRFRRRRLLERLGFERSWDDASLEALATNVDPELRIELGRLDRVLRGLPPDLKLAWMLRAVEGCELQDVAEQCGCSLATAKRRIAAAQAILKKAVDLMPIEDP